MGRLSLCLSLSLIALLLAGSTAARLARTLQKTQTSFPACGHAKEQEVHAEI